MLKTEKMSYTYAEILQRLMREKELDLLELLEITSEDLVYAFEEKIQAKLESIAEDYEEEQNDLNEEWGLYEE